MRNKDSQTRVCKACQQPLRNKKKKFCSDSCRMAWYSVKATPKIILVDKVCPVCKITFSARLGWQKYCTVNCQQQANREKAKEYVQHSPEYKLRFSVMARDGFRCRYCGRTAQDDGVKLVVDHIVPRSKNGDSEASNMITACSDCNAGKGDLLLLAAKGQIPSFLTIESLTSLPSSTKVK